MTVEKAVKAMEAGLTVLKFSLDAMDEEKLNQLEEKATYSGQSIKFTNFLKLKERGFKTLLVPNMIAINNDEESKKMHKDFMNFWKDKDVYAYVKSQIIDGCLSKTKN